MVDVVYFDSSKALQGFFDPLLDQNVQSQKKMLNDPGIVWRGVSSACVSWLVHGPFLFIMPPYSPQMYLFIPG